MINFRSLWQLTLCRFREFKREPEVIFWVFFFPLLLAMGLGIAFRDHPPDKMRVAVVEQADSRLIMEKLNTAATVEVDLLDAAAAKKALRLGKVALVIVPRPSGCEYLFDPTRPDGLLARQTVDEALQKAAGRQNPLATLDTRVTEPGGRYIDFLIPGLIGMNLMGGGMWGVGFSIVDMRIKKLLKRLMATPMRKADFMLAIILSRLVFMLAEVVVLLVFGRYAFGMIIQGSIGHILLASFLGSMCFTGLGLLVACRAKKIETVTGLINLVMLPMYVLSGVFFSSERFPQVFQPLIQALPLTALNNVLRAVILEGAGLASQLAPLIILVVWGGISALLAMRWFRWN